MRRVCFRFCLVLAACASVAAPHVTAGDQITGARFAQQWRIFPRPLFARPADEEITGRLTRQIDSLVAFFQQNGSSVPPETLGDSLIDAKARHQLFRLESLLRLYGRAFPDLDKYRVEVKEIEDGLGAYSFAADSLKFA